MANIWVYVDHFKGEVVPASWEAVMVARQTADKLGASVTAVVLGAGVEALANEAITYGADEALLADDAGLQDYRAEAYVSTLAKAAEGKDVTAIFFPTTTRAREIAGMAAIDLNSGVLVDVTALDVEGDKIVATRPVYAGKLLAKAVCNATPQLVTLRVRAFGAPEADASRSGSVTAIDAVVDAPTTVAGYTTAEGGVSLSDANVIVSAGRGAGNNPAEAPADLSDEDKVVWKAQEGFKLIGELAGVLGGAVGASRAAVDAGYIPYAHQVGQTGKVVSPDLYIAAGISGAIQHLAGMRSSKVIVAINKDAEAPIFKSARYGVVGDLYEIVPALTAALKERLG